jgi:hypothetical protein
LAYKSRHVATGTAFLNKNAASRRNFHAYRRSGSPFATNNDPKALGEFGRETIRESLALLDRLPMHDAQKKPRTMPGLRCFLLEKR